MTTAPQTLAVLTLFCFFMIIPNPVFGNGVEIHVVQSSRDSSDRLTRKPSIYFEAAPESPADVTVFIDSSKQFQQILGFGGAFTESGAYVFSKMTAQAQETVMNSYFGPDGLHYTVCRVHMNSCDFSLDSYSFANDEGDFALNNFNIEHDKIWLIPFIKKALNTTTTPIKIFASPWSPPAWMKRNGQMTGSDRPGLKFEGEYHFAWALYFSKFITAYDNEGIHLWGVTVQNEPEFAAPWEACVYNPEEQRDFVKNFLGPRLQEDHPNITLMIYDHNKDHIVEWVEPIFSDPDAAQYVRGTGFHWYSGSQFENVRAAHDLYPDRFLLPTEACNCPVSLNNWGYAEKYGYDIIGDLNNWAVGWVDWNMVLDIHGGPNHLGGNCDANFIWDEEEQRLHIQPTYYYMGQISKFILPDSIRIDTEVTSQDLQAVSVLTPENRVVTVVMNGKDWPINIQLKYNEMVASYEMKPHTMTTFSFQKF